MRIETLQRRVDRLGISEVGLAKQAGISRGAVRRALAGDAVRTTTIGVLEATMDRLEVEIYGERTDLDPPMVSTIVLPDGGTVTFTGSPEGVAEAAARFIAQRHED